MATLSISYEELGRITGEMAVQILTGEADVSELAIQYDTAVTKMYNAANCEALGRGRHPLRMWEVCAAGYLSVPSLCGLRASALTSASVADLTAAGCGSLT